MGIEGLADLNRDGFVTQRELYLHVAAEVFKIAGLKQNPQFLPALESNASDLPLFKLPADIGARVRRSRPTLGSGPQALDRGKATIPPRAQHRATRASTDRGKPLMPQRAMCR